MLLLPSVCDIDVEESDFVIMNANTRNPADRRINNGIVARLVNCLQHEVGEPFPIALTSPFPYCKA